MAFTLLQGTFSYHSDMWAPNTSPFNEAAGKDLSETVISAENKNRKNLFPRVLSLESKHEP